jgi:hypothetical protein
MDHVMSQAPGYETLKGWVAAPILPTPAAFGAILRLLCEKTGHRILAVDIGGATTDVFTARGDDVFRTVSANLGLSYSILNVAGLAGIAPMRELYHPHSTDAEMWNRIGNKHIHPTRLAATPDEMLAEWAAAAVAIREAVRQHLVLRDGATREAGPVRQDLDVLLKGPRPAPRPQTPFAGTEFDMVIGSGGVLSHSPRPAATAVLLDALAPAQGVELAVDSAFMFPHLGALAQVHPDMAVELVQQLGIVKLDRAGRSVASGYVPPAREGEPKIGPKVWQGELRLRRELAIPGKVLVREGQAVTADTLVARSTRQFLRPFFLHAAEAIDVLPAELDKYLLKRVGDEVSIGDAVARRKRRLVDKTYKSPVAGRVEKVLPTGVVVLRERPEDAREYTAVPVAKEFGVEPARLGPYLKVKPGDEVERGQWLAEELKDGSFRHVDSPVRGKVSRIDEHFGIVLIEPLLEELEVRAWLPGRVAETTSTGCIVQNEATVITGVWGCFGESSGELSLGDVAPGKVVVRDFADAAVVAQARERKPAALVCAGVNLADVLDPCPGFTVVVLNGFGEHRLSDELRQLLAAHEGRLVLADGTTQLRVGVVRPRVILPA